MKSTLTILASLVLAPPAALHAAAPSASMPQPAPSGVPFAPLPAGKWKLLFSDEFDGEAIDETKWKPSDYTQWKTDRDLRGQREACPRKDGH